MNQKTKIKIGLIGCGHLGRIHVQQMINNPLIDLIGVFDIQTIQAEKLSHEFNIKVFSSVDNLIDESEAIDIVTPTNFHFYYAEKAIKKFKQPVYRM